MAGSRRAARHGQRPRVHDDGEGGRQHHGTVDRPHQRRRSACRPATWAAPRARTSCSITPSCSRRPTGRELFFENDDGRIVLIYPLKGRVMVGTTDIDADPRRPVVCTEEEVDYFFELVHHVLPEIQLDRSQIVYRFAGIRPLPRHDDEAPGIRLARLPHRAGRAAGRGAAAQPGRRQVDHVPRPRRAHGEPRACSDRRDRASSAPRPCAIGGGSGLPAHRARPRRPGSPRTRPRSAPSTPSGCCCATAPSRPPSSTPSPRRMPR